MPPATPDSRPDSTDEQPTLQLEQLVANAVAEYLDYQAREEVLDPDQFCQRYPHLAPYLRLELETIQQLDDLLQPPPAAWSEAASDQALPARLSGHKILSEIGSGGMGRVLLAVDERLGRRVAIKTLKPRYANNPVLGARFLQEARAMARLNHPHIGHIYNLGQPDEVPHFVMEYIEGASLTEAARALTLRQKVELMRKVVLATDFLHQHQIIHRDLKPGNILVGPDLEPKVLDFGLARQIAEDTARLTRAGEVAGTPDYFSPEQAQGHIALDARSDIFSLGVIFYQLLTGVVPFSADNFAEQLRRICAEEPILPRRLQPRLPGALQNICLKALEKSPAERYATAREMADDLARFLAGEAVLAHPAAYARLMTGKIEQHLRELEGWRQDQILSDFEFDSFRQLYERLVEREDAWIMEVRRLSLAQVTLYLGAWVLVVGAALVMLFRYPSLAGTPAVLLVSATTLPTCYLGLRAWRRGYRRVGVAYLLAFCLLLPVTMLVAMNEWQWLTALTQNRPDLELFGQVAWLKSLTNAQLWWALFGALPAYFCLRRFTQASVFSLVGAVALALLCLVTLLRWGLLDWLAQDPGRFYFYLLPCGLLFFSAGLGLERLHYAPDSRYFYPLAVAFTFIALSGLALFHEPYAAWLKNAWPLTRGQIEYLFILNGGIYLVLQSLCEHWGTPQMRAVAKSLRFVIPGHVLASLLLLGWSAAARWQEAPTNEALRYETRFFEVLLPLVAALFIFGSIPKQMKNFLATGLIFLAIGLIRLQQGLFSERAGWPLSLLALGLLLMLLAANYTPLKLALTRWWRRTP